MHPQRAEPATPPSAPTDDQYSVSGRITWSDGGPAEGQIVRAVDRDLRGEEPLGPYAPEFHTETRSNRDGRYEISYRREQVRQAELGSADLVVRVLDGNRQVLVASPTLFNAPRHAVIDVVLAQGLAGLPSEYERVVTPIGRLLDRPLPGGLRELQPSDLTFLVGETNIASDRLLALLRAVALNSEALPPGDRVSDGAPRVAVDSAQIDATPGFYGLIRLGVPGEWDALAGLTVEQLTQHLTRAVAEAIIPADLMVARLAEFIHHAAHLVRETTFTAAAPLAEPDLRWAVTSTVDNPVVDSRLDRALAGSVEAALGTMSPQLRLAVTTVSADLSWRQVVSSTVAEVATTALRRAAGANPALAEESATLRRQLAQQPVTTVSDALHLTTTVAANPILASEVRAVTAAGLARVAGLPAAAVSAVTVAGSALFDAAEQTLKDLTERQTITAGQASALRAILDLGDLTDHNLPLVEKLSAQGPMNLAAWDSTRWSQFITQTATVLPPGETTETYAANLVANLEFAYPTQALAGQLAGNDQHMTTFLADNPALDVRAIRLAAGELDDLNWRRIPTQAQPHVVAELRSYQRLLALADTTTDRALLASKGFDSALAITANTESQFVARSGLEAGFAKLTYARAQDVTAGVSHAFGAASDIFSGPWHTLPFYNFAPTFINDLLKVDGMSQLFGSQDFCDCGDCQSVLSPAAYFVDLMHFTESHVSKPVFLTPGLTNHPLYLKTRRPDLWQLTLTCENTNRLVPYLTIVNEVLETYLGQVLGADPYTVIASAANTSSCQVPWSLPYAELGLYLGFFDLTPADIYELLRSPGDQVARARAGLSADEATVVTTADPSGVLQRLALPDSGGLTNLGVQAFIRRLGLRRDQLTTVLASRHDVDLAAITVGKTVVAGQFQNFKEVLQNLTADRADRIHRLVRLSRGLPWSLVELDLLLLTARTAGLIGPSLDEASVGLLGRLAAVQKAWALTPDQLCSIIGDLPVSTSFPLPPPAAGDRLLYEQIFDLPALFGVAVASTGELNQVVNYYHYSADQGLGTNPAMIDPKTPLLLTALGISETDLLLLFDLLCEQLPFSTAGVCSLDRAKLSLLYRHVVAARALKVTVPDLIAALRLSFAASSLPLTTLDQIETLVELGRWLATSPLQIPQLQLIATGVESATARYTHTVSTAAAMVQAVQAATSAPDLVPTLRSKVGAAFNAGAGRLTDLLTWTGLDIGSAPIRTALAATFTDGVPDNPSVLQPLLELLRRLERVALLFGTLQADDATVRFVTANPDLFGIADRTAPRLRDLRALVSYRAFATRTIVAAPAAVGASTAGTATDAASVTQSLLLAYAGTTAFPPADLSALLHAERSLVDSAVAAVALPPVPIAALDRVREILEACARLGVNAYSLVKLGQDTDFAALSAAAQVALGAVGAKYTDEAARETALEPYQDRVNALKRDALCSYLIDGRPELRFTDHEDLYNYFLLDVDMSGCGRTSRVVAATNSVQLYLQRCQTGVEQSDPAIVSVPAVRIDPGQIPAVELSWRKNFRVWQANRKVFLYPESYLDPDLRDDKTPAYEMLADDLLQKQITDDTAAEAYAGYLTELSTLSHLKIAGTFYDSASGTYYFFGRTQQDPPVFFYRTWDTTTWTPWVRIDLPIEGPYVSAVVHLGRLHVFWVEPTTKDHTTISGGSSQTDYFTVRVRLAYSVLKPNGKWKPPQKVDWLYPSGQETISATDKVFKELHATPDERVAEMELSRTYRKTYPRTVGENIIHRYHNPFLSPYRFDRRLDLFHNRLVAGAGIPDLGTKTALGLYFNNNSAQLGIERRNYQTEVTFDTTREQPFNVATTHTLVTTAFAYENRTSTDPGRTFIMHAVHNGFPESVLQVGDQQFLVHEESSLFSDWGRYLAKMASVSSVSLARTALSDGPAFAAARTLSSPQLSTTGLSATGLSTTGLSTTALSGVGLKARLLVPEAKVFVPVRASRRLIRLSTSVADLLGETEAAGGLDRLLGLDTQRLAKERALPFTITSPAELGGPQDDPNHIDLKGAFGGYFQELYFHVPWMIARQLNAAGRYADAMRWYQHIFDPTAAPSAADATPTDRNWRYVGFRGLTVPTLQQMLTDRAALAAYAADPFNPFAIARLRPVAFQKAIVMQFVDNLLDWGDSLFAQDTMESINEATMLYMLAAEILGPRPVSLGECETVDAQQLTYAAIGPRLDGTSDFLVKLENWVYESKFAMTTATAPAKTLAAQALAPNPGGGTSDGVSTLKTGPVRLLSYSTSKTLVKQRLELPPVLSTLPATGAYPSQSVTHSSLVFCVPPNDVLMAYWDRVADRLFKIRNCMNISGVRRSLALFAPPIDPMDLVRARAAGLSIEAALVLLDTPVPPYRFVTLIDRARQAASLASSFGATLLAALERKDTEELTLLRSLHEQTVLRSVRRIKTSQVEEAQHQLQSIVANATLAQNRVNHFQGLLEAGLNGWEVTEEISQHTATGLRIGESVVHLHAALTYLIPQVGSPFAMKYGGQELGHSFNAFAEWSQSMAGIAKAVAESAGLEATFERRRQEWQYQLGQAQQETVQIEQQRLAAALRADNAQRELDLHILNTDQAAELDDFYKGKFTNVGLYTYLARTLTTLHRQAYDAAYRLANAAQRAYGFERDDTTVFVAPDNWEGDRAGLLSGERLLTQLQQLENAYLTGNRRTLEVTQSFPLSLVAARSLVELRETGSATFELPEILFDIAYPGHYRRIVKAVRVTLAGVTGQYTNVGAKLTMTQSSVRETTATPLTLRAVQPNILSAIATSTGLNDGGQFQLDFRDERYLPFEGAGAVSAWRLELPEKLRSFDYQTISDVVIHLSYTALEDGALRQTVEDGLVSRLTQYAATTGMFRLFSLRHDFPSAWHQLTGTGTSTGFAVTAQHFPYFLATSPLTTVEARLFLLPASEAAGGGPSAVPVATAGLGLSVNGAAAPAWATDAGCGLASATVPLSGSPVAGWTVAVTSGQLDPTKVGDVVLLLRYRTT